MVRLIIRIRSTACLALFAGLLIWVVVGRDNSPGFAGNIYQTSAIVTGEREETKLPVLGQCLKDVLKKVSGGPVIDRDLRIEAFAGQAQAHIQSFCYRDRMEGIPIHDEQGVRDRPYDLTVDFHPESFVAATWLTGMPMTLPSTAAFNEAGMTAEKLPMADPGELVRIARASGGGTVLVGSIVWDKGMLGWKADWQLYSDGGPHHWQIRNANYDAAFRGAKRGAAQVFSGNGDPQNEVQ